MLLTVLSTFAQRESKNMSKDIRGGCEAGLLNGNFRLCELCALWVQAGQSGRVAIVEPDAETVRRTVSIRAEGEDLGVLMRLILWKQDTLSNRQGVSEL